MFAAPPVTFVNGEVLQSDGTIRHSLRVHRGRIESVGNRPQRGDTVVDVDRAVILPGLINAHDHLELNSFGRLKWRARYDNVAEWISDFQPRFDTEPVLAAARPETLRDRLWVGGLKNLLSGVTTVCHHNPLHRPLRRRFPVRLVRQLTFSHSLLIDGPAVARTSAATPPAWPWIVHAAEGVDARAAREIDTLDALRCLRPNTVLVHGVAIDPASAARAIARGTALIWCPSSNVYLFQQTADVRQFDAAGALALGSDSRLSGDGDLLDEMRAAHTTAQLPPARVVHAATAGAARVLRLCAGGRLRPGDPADILVLRRVDHDPFASVVASARRDVLLTMIEGEPLVAAAHFRSLFRWPHSAATDASVDGVPKLLARWVAHRVRRMRLAEPGLQVDV
jgi:cytosine/adenosine deaminase-related metal-dependent hydrolase